MPFVKGHTQSTGRPKGSINKRTRGFMNILEEKGFCPATALITCYEDARQRYDELTLTTNYNPNQEDEAHRYLKIASDNAKELASYAYPKLKAVEHQEVSPLDGMTPFQKLEAMKAAVLMLELEIQCMKEKNES